MKRDYKKEYQSKLSNPLRLARKRLEAMNYKLKVKLEVLSHYGPSGDLNCSWPGCEVDDIDILSLDHVDGGGNEDRRTNNCAGGTAQYVRLRMLGFPDGFQTLCMNHQFKKDILNRRELAHEQITALRKRCTRPDVGRC